MIEPDWLTIVVNGRVATPPKSAYTKKGVVLEFLLPANMPGKTVYFWVHVWGKMAVACKEYLCVGRLVTVEAHTVEVKAYLSSDKQPKAKLIITADFIRFLDNNLPIDSIDLTEEDL